MCLSSQRVLRVQHISFLQHKGAKAADYDPPHRVIYLEKLYVVKQNCVT